MQTEQSSYDAVAYPGLAYGNTHPDGLAVMAILHGLSPAPVEHCRVLEVACGNGSNLIPMAYAIPTSEFVGFDLARLPVERGLARIQKFGLKNIQLLHCDLLEVGRELGEFDYIIAHGLYAWVPEPVRDRLLALCGELLAPQGVAFVSYNALPGSHLRMMVRDMMQFGREDCEDSGESVSKALEFVHFVAETRPEDDPYRHLIEAHLKMMEKRVSEATYHDELNEFYRPVHFVDFAKHAAVHGLQYLSESELPLAKDPGYRSALRASLEEMAGNDVVRQEQILDFARMRAYRETLLCRADCALRRDFPFEHLRRLRMSSPAKSSPGEKPGAVAFTLADGIKLESNHPVAIALLEALESAWPHTLSFEELEPRLASAGFAFDREGTTLLMRLAVSRMIEFHFWSAPVARSVSERPRASAISRDEVRTSERVTTLLHTMVDLKSAEVRKFLTLLDGTRDRGELVAAIKTDFPNMTVKQVEESVEPNLAFAYRAALLEA